VHGVGAAALDDVEDGLGVQVTLGGGGTAKGVGLVGEPHVHGVAIEVGIHGDRRNAELATRPDNPNGDLAAVGNKDLREHRGRSIAECDRRLRFIGLRRSIRPTLG
jgi:hypothetical protein